MFAQVQPGERERHLPLKQLLNDGEVKGSHWLIGHPKLPVDLLHMLHERLHLGFLPDFVQGRLRETRLIRGIAQTQADQSPRGEQILESDLLLSQRRAGRQPKRCADERSRTHPLPSAYAATCHD